MEQIIHHHQTFNRTVGQLDFVEAEVTREERVERVGLDVLVVAHQNTHQKRELGLAHAFDDETLGWGEGESAGESESESESEGEGEGEGIEARRTMGAMHPDLPGLWRT